MRPHGWRSLASVFPRYDDPLLAESGMVIVQGDDGPEQKRYDRFRDRIMFPIRSVKGEVIGFGGRVLDGGEPKYLNSPETPVFVKGRELYGLFEARTAPARARAMRWWSRATWTWWRWRRTASPMRWPRWARPARPSMCRSCFASPTRWSSASTAMPPAAAPRGRALEASLPHATDLRSVRFLFLPPEHDPDSFVRELGPAGLRRAGGQGRAAVAAAGRPCQPGRRPGQRRRPRPHAGAGQARCGWPCPKARCAGNCCPSWRGRRRWKRPIWPRCGARRRACAGAAARRPRRAPPTRAAGRRAPARPGRPGAAPAAAPQRMVGTTCPATTRACCTSSAASTARCSRGWSGRSPNTAAQTGAALDEAHGGRALGSAGTRLAQGRRRRRGAWLRGPAARAAAHVGRRARRRR